MISESEMKGIALTTDEATDGMLPVAVNDLIASYAAPVELPTSVQHAIKLEAMKFWILRCDLERDRLSTFGFDYSLLHSCRCCTRHSGCEPCEVVKYSSIVWCPTYRYMECCDCPCRHFRRWIETSW